MNRLFLLAMVLLLLGSGAAAQSPDGNQPRFYASAVSPWHRGPDGVERMNLVGDSISPTAVNAFRLRYPAGVGKDSSKASIHFHFGTEHVLVLKGTYVIGFGNSPDFSQAKVYTEGGFVVIPSGVPHYEWTRGETEIQIEALGPSRTIPWPRSSFQAARMQPPSDVMSAGENGLTNWSNTPSGVAMMRLAGAVPPSPAELVAFRIHFPPGAVKDTIYHYHFGSEHITILKGTLWFAIGEHADPKLAKPYGPGSFIENPSGAKHFEWIEGDNIAHIESIGGLGAINLDKATGQPR